MEQRPASASGACKPPVYCKGCGTRLLTPSYDLNCGFCRIEINEAFAKATSKAAA